MLKMFNPNFLKYYLTLILLYELKRHKSRIFILKGNVGSMTCFKKKVGLTFDYRNFFSDHFDD